MSAICPCCGHEIDSVPIDGLAELPLTVTQRAYVEALVRIHPRPASFEYLVDALWGSDPNGGPAGARNTIDVHRVNINRKLRAVGWEIVTGRGRTKALRQIGVTQQMEAA